LFAQFDVQKHITQGDHCQINHRLAQRLWGDGAMTREAATAGTATAIEGERRLDFRQLQPGLLHG
jgi:hypothetical protein